MKSIVLTALFSIFIISSSSSVYSQPYVVIDTLGGLNGYDKLCGEVVLDGGSQMHQLISISNPDSIQTEIRLDFRYTSQNGISPFSPITVEYFNGIDTLFSTIVIEHDTSTHIIHISLSNGQLPIELDTITYFAIIRSFGGSEGNFVCVDSANNVPTSGWYFDHASNTTSSGIACYSISPGLPNCCLPFVTNCPESLYVSNYCETVNYDFNMAHPGINPIFFEVYGPGSIDNNGNYTYIPNPEDAGETFSIQVETGGNWCQFGGGEYIRWSQGGCEVKIVVGTEDPPPKFLNNQKHSFVATTAETLTVQLEYDDVADPCQNYNFTHFVSAQDSMPPGIFDTATGAFHYYGTSADTAVYYVYIVMNEGDLADTSGFYIYHFESYICGDMNHLSGINISDLTWMVDYLFKGGLEPITYLAGDVDCSGDINISDLTYFVNYLFKSGPEPCESGCS